MCLSDAGRIVELVGPAEAVVDLRGALRRVSLVALELEGQPPAIDDWVLVHTGFAVERLDEDHARELAALRDTLERGDTVERGGTRR